MKAKLPNRIDPFVNGRPRSGGRAGANGHPAANGQAHAPVAPGPVPPPQALGTDRTAGGRFQPGCRPGPGNPFAKRVAGLRKALLESVGEADVAGLGRKLLDLALGGDVAAAKVLLSYVVGRPAEPIDPDRLELEAWKLLLSWPTVAEVIATTWAVRPAAAADVVTSGAPATGEEVLMKAADPVPLEAATRVMRRREEEGR